MRKPVGIQQSCNPLLLVGIQCLLFIGLTR